MSLTGFAVFFGGFMFVMWLCDRAADAVAKRNAKDHAAKIAAIKALGEGIRGRKS